MTKPRAPRPTKPPRAATASAITRYDPLRAYMRDVGRYALLDKDEEQLLARQYKESGDPQAAFRLVTSNLRLVVKIAFEYQRYYQNVLDLIQEGNIGLMQAVKKFDPDRGFRLSTYARYWIQAYILYFLLANHRMVKIGTTQEQRKVFFNLAKAHQRLRQEGREPTPALLAEELGVSEHVVVEMTQRLGHSEASMETPLISDDSDSPTLGAMLRSTTETPEEAIGAADFRDQITTLIRAFGDTLTEERERFLWDQRMRSEEPLTLAEVGKHFGITRERTRQIEAKVRERLRKYLEDHMPGIEQLTQEALS